MTTSAPLPPAILLVDDEPDIRFILSRVVEHIADGYEVIAVDTGAAALAVLNARPILLLITDYNMPGMNGLELLEAAKAASPTTLVAVITAFVTPELEKRALAAGADYYLPKPLAFDRLEAVVRQALA
jgi:two-component system, response regulator, stage 0 sporulation protein F